VNDNGSDNGNAARGFYYFVPGNRGAVPEALKYALPAGAAKAVTINGGPRGAGGTVYAEPRIAIPHDLASIDWTPMPAAEFSLGVGAGGAPGPEDLIRDEIVDGYPVTLGDGADWIVPLGRVWPEGTRIPSTMGYGPDGSFVTSPVPRFAALCAKAERIFDAVAASYGLIEDRGGIEPIDDGREGFDLAVEILAVNYRIGPAEASRLALIDTTNLKYAIGCFADLPAIHAEWAARAEKKTDTGGRRGGSTPGGGPA